MLLQIVHTGDVYVFRTIDGGTRRPFEQFAINASRRTTDCKARVFAFARDSIDGNTVPGRRRREMTVLRKRLGQLTPSEGSVFRRPHGSRVAVVVFWDGRRRRCGRLLRHLLGEFRGATVAVGAPGPVGSNLCASASNSQSCKPTTVPRTVRSSISSSPLLSRSKRVRSVFTRVGDGATSFSNLLEERREHPVEAPARPWATIVTKGCPELALWVGVADGLRWRVRSTTRLAYQ